MPLFNFICEDCGQHFETWVRTSSAVDEVTCPVCESEQVKRQLSRVAGLASSSKSPGSTTSYASNCAPGGG